MTDDTMSVQALVGKSADADFLREMIALKGGRVLEITYSKDRVNAGQVLAAVQEQGLGIVDVSTREADLEDVFLSLTRGSAGS